LVTNVGLNELISLSVPVLYTVYPVAIALVALTLCNNVLTNKTSSHRFVLSVAFFFGLLDGLKVAGINMDAFTFLPLFDKGMAWVLPVVAALIISSLFFKTTQETEPQIAQAS